MTLFKRPHPAAKGRRIPFAVLGIGLVLSGCCGCACHAAEESVVLSDQKNTFDPYEVSIGMAKRQTVLTGFLLGGAMADLGVVNIGENGDLRLHVYGFHDNAWVHTLEATLSPGVSFVDVASIDGRDRLIMYEGKRLTWFDPESAISHPLMAVTSNFNRPRENEIPHVDITRDVNGDGLDDLIVPDEDGFWVIVQMSDGRFADPVKIGPTADMSGIYGADGYRYDPWSQSRVHNIDYNQDGRNDLVFWIEDHFEAHLQDASRRFNPKAEIFTTNVAFDSDDAFSLATGDMAGRVLHSLEDMNGDGVGDLVVFELSGKRLEKKRSVYAIHFGAVVPGGGTAFAQEPDVTFESDSSIQIGMERIDSSGDGSMNLMFTTMDVKFLGRSLWKEMKGAMGDDVRLNLEFYRPENGVYSDKPNAVRTIALDGAPSHREPGWVPLDLVLRGGTHESRTKPNRWPRAFNPNLLIGNVTGDGHVDLLYENTFRGLEVYTGVPGSEVFATQPQSIRVNVPHDREYSWLVDLNKDGKQDIVMHHPFTSRDVHGGRTEPLGTEPHRVVTLIAQ